MTHSDLAEFAISTAVTGSAQAAAVDQLRHCANALSFPVDEADLLVIAATEQHDAAALIAQARDLAPNAQIHGLSSCLGAMTDKGALLDAEASVTLWALRDARGSYGSATVAIDDATSAHEAAAKAVREAILRADRIGELPEAIWLNATPGEEEAIVAGIQSVVGMDLPILGGSAADNSVSGNWFIFDNQGATANGVALSVLFPSVEIGYSFHSGYAPSGESGRVTKAEGRRLIEVDDQPAAQVYDRWSDGAIGDLIANGGGEALMHSSLHPIGRKQGGQGDVAFGGANEEDFVLSHPARVHSDGSLDLFTEVEVGEQLIAMSGTPSNLASRAGRVASNACQSADIDPRELSGALVIYCAGCMLTIQDRMGEVASGLNQALDGKPFAGLFTFGEQGCFPDGESRHGNLMISALVFGQ